MKEIRNSLEKMFNNEFIDIAFTIRAISEIDKEVINYMPSLMCFVNIHYEIALLSFPDNRAPTFKRLISIKCRFKINDSYNAMYVSAMTGYFDKGCAE